MLCTSQHFHTLPRLTAAASHAGEAREGGLALLRVPVDREEIFFSLSPWSETDASGLGWREDFTMGARFLKQLVLGRAKGHALMGCRDVDMTS